MKLLRNVMFSKNLLRHVQLHTEIRCFCSLHLGPRSKVLSSRACDILTNIPHVRSVHPTTKGWKFTVRKEISPEESQNDMLVACEEGTEAVPHDVLMSCLQDCSSVEEQINQFCLKLSLPKEDFANRKAFSQSLSDLLVPYFPNMKITLFGSSINGFGFKGCDCDVAINVTGREDSEERQVKIGLPMQIPSVADVESGKVGLENLVLLPPRLLLRFVRRVFRSHSVNIREPILLVKARHPILRFYDKKYNLFCDFSCGKNASLRNTRVLCFIRNLDVRVVPLIKILRYWGKSNGFIGNTDHFNSYGFSLLIAYFLQNTSPPVLPPISELLEKSGYVEMGNIDDDKLLLNDLMKFSPSKNTQTVEELLREFFFYFMYYDFSQVLCPLSSSCRPKMEFRSKQEPFEFSTIAIQDPFRPSYNVTHSAAERCCRLFLRNVLHACESYQKDSVWVPDPCRTWGIPVLLDPHLKNQTTVKETQLVHMIEIPLETTTLLQLLKSGLDIDSIKTAWFQKASKAVIDVFEYGLLFECSILKNRNIRSASAQAGGHNVSYTNDSVDLKMGPNSALKMECVAHHNVFSGRSNFRDVSLPCDVNSVLEKEHTISVTLSQKEDADRNQVLFNFQCECSQLEKEVPTLLVSLTFQNYQPAVVVFLKEYLPKFVQCLVVNDGMSQ